MGIDPLQETALWDAIVEHIEPIEVLRNTVKRWNLFFCF